MTEKLINHIGVVQLDGAYYKPTKEKMFDAYKKAILELTIDNSERLKVKNEQQQKKISELEIKTARIDDLERRMRVMEKSKEN
jgi:integrase/recombinase XerD